MSYILILIVSTDNAKKVCEKFGPDWNISRIRDGSVVCTRGNTTWKDNCAKCRVWRMAVFLEGSNEHGSSIKTGVKYTTMLRKYYGGINRCQSPWDPHSYSVCGDWESMFLICNQMLIYFECYFQQS